MTKPTAVILPLLAAWLAAIAAAVLYLAGNRWFGAGDLPSMALWTLPMVLLEAFAILVWRRFANPERWILTYTVAILIGPVIGVLAFIAVALVLGPWIGAFSFPVIFCWIFGALVGCIVFAYISSRRMPLLALGAVTTAVLVMLYANAYARAPEPRFRLYLADGITNSQVNEVWENVIGRPSPSGTGHDMLDGLTGAAASGYEGDRPILTITMRKRLSRAQRDSLLAQIGRSPLVARIEMVSPSDTTGVRTSVSY